MSGALVLSLIVWIRGSQLRHVGNWPSALALFVYAAGFSFAYVSLPASTGALILFAAVQTTMIGYGIRMGERLAARQWMGLACALAGLVGLLVPGLSAPPPGAALLMLAAGIAWGIYSLRGKGASDPTARTAGNFVRAVPFAVALSAITYRHAVLDFTGFAYAAVSGALTSGIGYVLWYAALPKLRATHAATVQLSVPVIAAIGALIFLGESLTPRIVLASVAILGGIAIVVAESGRLIAWRRLKNR
jgi:drug/metabolite transporter (DMT)-like permease